MAILTLQHDNRNTLKCQLQDGRWIVACLCAAWCDVCKKYQRDFIALSERHPDKHFVWIDIEDHADIVGDFEVENFPVLLIQRKNTVVFYGTIEPDASQSNRLIDAQTQILDTELEHYISKSPERIHWQEKCNLLLTLGEVTNP